jgi:hypothetical protein
MDDLKKVNARFFATETGEEPVPTWLKLDPRNTAVTLHTLQRAAAAVGKRLRLDLVE